MRGILEHRHSFIDRQLKDVVLFEPESVLVFFGSQTSTEGIITILNRSGQTLQYSVKSNNKYSYKVKEPKGYLTPGKNMIYFMALKKNNNEEQMVTGDKFRIDVWRCSRPFDKYCREYKVALKDDRLQDTGEMINENGFSTMVQNSGRTGTFASFNKKSSDFNIGKIGIPKPTNKILLNQQKQIQRMSTKARVLQQQVNQLRDQEALLQKKFLVVLEQKQDSLVKWYLVMVTFGFIIGIILRYIWSNTKLLQS